MPQYVDDAIGIEQLRKAIPARCFQPVLAVSLYYYLRDISFMAVTLFAAIQIEQRLESTLCKYIFCLGVYPFVVGIPATGFWVLGHEAGHGSFSKSQIVGDFFGFIAHSFLMSPFFSWRSTHSRHHVYANHMIKVWTSYSSCCE